MKVYYFHGFASCFKKSGKFEALSQKFPQADFPEHTLPYHQENFLEKVEQIRKELSALDPNEVILFGTSLGGFMAHYFGRMFSLPHYIFNPAYSPTLTLQKYIGQKVTYYPEPSISIEMTPQEIKPFELLDQEMQKVKFNPEQCHVFLGSEDDLIDPILSQAYFQTMGVKPMIYQDDHRFETHFKEIVLGLEI